jgi:hypothetical protein
VELEKVPSLASDDERAVHQGRMRILGGQGPGPGGEYELRQTSWRECSRQSYPEPAARLTYPPGFSSNVKICIAVYIIYVLLVLFLLVMRIWVDLQVLKIWDFGYALKSRQAKLSQAKPALWEACQGIHSEHGRGRM